MELTVRKFDSFEAAEAAEIEEDMAMTPEERIGVVLAIRERLYDNARSTRICASLSNY